MRFVIGIVVAISCAGCGTDSSADAKSCVPGESRACTGPAGCAGGQICKDDGTGFLPCDCGAGGASGASGAAGQAGDTGICPKGLPGPELVEIPALDGTRYCIDSTEVTFADYDAFLAAKLDPFEQPGVCMNNAFALDSSCLFEANKSPGAPVVCVDGCQAPAFCRWAGKRLCGKIGGGSLTITWDGTNVGPIPDETTSQWENACDGGFPGVYGMVEGPAEWEDAGWEYEPGMARVIRAFWLAGGGCNGDFVSGSETRTDISFRCCHDGGPLGG